MDVKKKLVELIDDFIHNVDLKRWYSEKLDEKLADDLIAHGVTVQEWISVKDRLPEEDKNVLSITQSGNFSIDMRDKHTGRWFGELCYSSKVTHWMPLPEPPKGE